MSSILISSGLLVGLFALVGLITYLLLQWSKKDGTAPRPGRRLSSRKGARQAMTDFDREWQRFNDR